MDESKMMIVFQKIAIATGETLDDICNMQEEERNALISVLDLKNEMPCSRLQEPIIIANETDSDDDILVKSPQKEKLSSSSVWISSDDEDQKRDQVGPGPTGAFSSKKRKVEEDQLEYSGRGWGECPVCDQIMPIPKLQLHAMACQGLEGNGGSGLEVMTASSIHLISTHMFLVIISLKH